jgi:hypothetical protein
VSKPGKRQRFWSYPQDQGGHAWHSRLRLGRLEFGYDVYKHTFARSSDRWVFQPFWIWNRR